MRHTKETNIIAAREKYENAKRAVDDLVEMGVITPTLSLDYERQCAQDLISTTANWYERSIHNLLEEMTKGRSNA